MSLSKIVNGAVCTAFDVLEDLGQKVKVVVHSSKTFNHTTGVATTTHPDIDSVTPVTGFMSHKNQRTEGTDNQPTSETTVIFKYADVSDLTGCDYLLIGSNEWNVDDWYTDPVAATLTATVSRRA